MGTGGFYIGKFIIRYDQIMGLEHVLYEYVSYLIRVRSLEDRKKKMPYIYSIFVRMHFGCNDYPPEFIVILTFISSHILILIM